MWLMIESLGAINFMCLFWLLLCWIGYSQFAKVMARKTNSLSSILKCHRVDWMRQCMVRELRVADSSIIGNLERNVSFFASTSMLIIAGVLTAFGSVESVYQVFSDVAYISDVTPMQIRFKLLVLGGVFIYAFFTFTWSMRQFGFASVLLGALPYTPKGSISPDLKERYARNSGKVLDQAFHSFNYGLRAYYFSLALLAWFIHPYAFLVAVVLVVAVLYHREFRSNTLKALCQVNLDWHYQDRKSSSKHQTSDEH